MQCGECCRFDSESTGSSTLYRSHHIVLILALALPEYARSQVPISAAKHGSVDFNLGFGEIENFSSTASVNARVRQSSSILTLQLLYTHEMGGIVFGAPSDFETPDPLNDVLSVGLLFGQIVEFQIPEPRERFATLLLRGFTGDYAVSASVGVSVTNGILRTTPRDIGSRYSGDHNYNFEYKPTVGCPAEIEFVKYYSRSFGTVHRLYYNFNDRQKFWALLWGVQWRFGEEEQ